VHQAELLVVFGLAAAVTWVAGITLADATDGIDHHFGLGEALGGMLLLGFAGTLPEIAITVSAALGGHLALATGNLLGGIAIQTLILALLDLTSHKARPLEDLSDAVEPMLEALLVILVVAIILTGPLLSPTATVGPVSPASIGVVVAYVMGMWLLSRVRKRQPWTAGANQLAETAEDEPSRTAAPRGRFAAASARTVVMWFGVAALATLAAGVALEQTGSALADGWGINGAIFGATILAAVTALPEVSTGMRAVRLGEVGLAMGDIFGGNAAQISLFIVADLLAGQPVIHSADREAVWLGSLGIVMTAIALAGLLDRPERKHFRMAPVSWAMVAAYTIGVVGLLFLQK